MLREFNFAALPVEDLSQINWKDIQAIQISESGSAKVIFVETQKGAVVLKVTGEVGVDLFLNQLAQEIQVLCPKMRIVGWKEPEYEEIILALTYAAQSNELLSYRLEQRLEVAFFEIIQYIPGMSLQYLGYKLIPTLFHVNSSSGIKRMVSLGRVYALDMFLNNCDRFPLNIWPNEGNSENLLLRFTSNDFIPHTEFKKKEYMNLEFENFYAIDHRMILQCETQLQNQIIEKYQIKLKELLELIFQSIEVIDDILKVNQNNVEQVLGRFKKLIYDYSHYDVSVQTQFNIIVGMILGFKSIDDFGFLRFQQLQHKLKLSEIMDWEGNFNENLGRIHMQFYEKQFEIIKFFLMNNATKVSICSNYFQ